jgi:hypothetical protein
MGGAVAILPYGAKDTHGFWSGLARIIHVDPDLIAVYSYGHFYESVIFTALVWWCSGDPGAF